MRAWLTILGIFIGIAAVVSLISIGQGLQSYVSEQFEQVGGDKILIDSGVFAPPGSITEEELIITQKDLDVIRDATGVEDAEGYLTRINVVSNGKEQEIVFINGVNERYLDIFGDTSFTTPIEGRQLEDSDRNKIVVGNNHIYGDLWSRPLRLGDDLEIKGKNFEIVGVLERQGNGGDDNSVWMQKESFRELFQTGEDEGSVVATIHQGYEVEDVVENIEDALRDERNEEVGEETFSVQSFSQFLETFTDIFAAVQAVLIGIAAISLVVGGIGIMNTMYTSVLERTKEIGTMKAVGARNSDILQIFLFESGLLGLVGGVIGVSLGVGIGIGVEYVARVQLGTPFLQAVFGWQLILGALAFSFIIGALSGVLPAMQAARLKPAEALRYE